MKALRILAIILLLAGGAARAPAAERLTIGSKAPPIDIEHWLTKKKPVTEFRRDHVYVIEFWATWCGPCVASMPHLRDLQTRHDKNITVISVSDESKDAIEEFLDREKDGSTFREITNHYWLAADPDGSVNRDYMQAAELSGIPTAFIVGRSGEIEWIGHPMRIDEPLARILANDWDRDAFARQMGEEQELRAAMRIAFDHARQHRYPEALAAIDKIRTGVSAPDMRQRIEIARQQIEAQARAGDKGPPAVPGERGQINIRQLTIGDHVTVPVTGKKTGAVWGDAIYTLDSDLGTAAVHAGLVREGETKTIRVWIVPSPGSFSEADRNGVQSRRWGPFQAAFIMQAAVSPAAANQALVPQRSTDVIGRLEVGESMTIPLTGTDQGAVWGTTVYTGDSRLEAVAVHAGALRKGERAAVIVTRVKPPARFEGSSKNGVRSSSWGPYSSAFTVMRQ